MADERIELAVGFIRSHPESAAAVLEGVAPEAVAAFLAGIPRPVAALAVGRMLPRHAAAALRAMEPQAAAGLAGDLPAAAAAAILRHMGLNDRAALLERLPARAQAACTLLLTFARDQVGAWMAPDIATVPADVTVGEARRRLRAQDGAVVTEPVLVVDRERRVTGAVPLEALVGTAPRLGLAAVRHDAPPALRGRTGVAAAAGDPGWEDHDLLVVVDRHGRLIGILRHRDLRHALGEGRRAAADAGAPPEGTGLLGLYGASLLALVDLMGPGAEAAG
jgi:Mg/Co/Ni transporter MgtE